ncbi:hypothetical protein DRE_01049 [Drechslerella stenobrocha 248]|uniref:Uncharacterized protein n=1 Tax=Drechslerella stenobrocha 248 TaxID=1043628 RepID=W7I7Q7_9PEZI|nr:hypothetical protein DRE_01049 [Drechslerella stenobrocha 248]
MVEIGPYSVSETQIKYTLWGVAGVYVVGKVAGFITTLAAARRKYRIDPELPQPPHSWFLGHLLVMAGVAQRLPLDVHPHVMIPFITEKYGLKDKGICYLDLWPVGPPMMVVTDPNMAHQVTQAHVLDKAEGELDNILLPLSGPGNLVSISGPTWKFWRTVFNPGFAAGHLMTLVPEIVDDCETFCEVMKGYAESGKVVNLEKATTCLTVDIIGRVVCDEAFDTQHKPHPLVEAFKSQIAWLRPSHTYNPWHIWHPYRPLMQWWNSRNMRGVVGGMLDKRFLSRDPALNSGKRNKPIIDLALETYLKEKGGNSDKMDAEFRSMAITQMLVFLFAGHDTTSSTICYIFHKLAEKPEQMARARKELDEIFGTDPDNAGRMLKENPQLMNKMEYCTAVIREVLRMYPPGSTVRQGEKGFYVKDPKTGQLYPTDGFLVWVVSVAVQLDDKYWKDPREFRPERWLEPDVPREAWRPFERGPRNCIGQELALIETKVIMAVALRRFDIEAQRQPPPANGVNDVLGDHVYQVLAGTAKPKGGMPAIIKMAPRIL